MLVQDLQLAIQRTLISRMARGWGYLVSTSDKHTIKLVSSFFNFNMKSIVHTLLDKPYSRVLWLIWHRLVQEGERERERERERDEERETASVSQPIATTTILKFHAWKYMATVHDFYSNTAVSWSDSNTTNKLAYILWEMRHHWWY